MNDLRMLMKMKNIPYWKVAKQIGCSEMTLYRWLRTFDADHHKRIMNAINQLSGGENNDEIN